MTALTFTKYEVIRTVRNRYFFIFSLIFPLVLYFVIAGANKNAKINHIPFPLYYMSGMIAWGAMMAVVSGGARIAMERTQGWTRQIRITPLSAGGYILSKVVTGYLMACLSILVIALAGVSLGVSLSAGHWLLMVVLVLIGLIPFAALGVLIGHLLSSDSMGPAMGGVVSLFALLGGAWGPLANSGVLFDIMKLIPSYWLVVAGESSLTGHGWSAEGWIVIAAWTVVLGRLALWAWNKDTKKA